MFATAVSFRRASAAACRLRFSPTAAQRNVSAETVWKEPLKPGSVRVQALPPALGKNVCFHTNAPSLVSASLEPASSELLQLGHWPQQLSRGARQFTARSSVVAPLMAGSRPFLANASLSGAIGTASSAGGVTAFAIGSIRGKQTKRQAYHKPKRASPCGQRMPNKAHIGIKALSSEYVVAGRLICKQRKFIAKNPGVTRNRHFKIYPGVNVVVMKNTSLQAAVSGRVKMTHDVTRDVLIMNVLAEPMEELLRDEMWRYRTEHVQSMEENRHLIYLRSKALLAFGKDSGWVNPPLGPKPVKTRISDKNDSWNNPTVQDPFEIEPFAYPLPRHLLAQHIKKVRRKQAGVPDEQNDPDFQVKDTRYHLFRGQSAQR
eukprot:TRINITY_DN19100_c0_g1_i1.p1 TRINITY_DN19100_c0_g1~~TRINITY_DN19100_c0_g1_i1.p1  ORF type:complete len:374 (+),score=39.51 TRINITY_DN19100_c0_g1_i1:93-1214(+)